MTKRSELSRAKGRASLPADPEGRNDKRGSWAGFAVLAFQRATGTDDEDALSDLLADLMHWADREYYDFDAALLRGRGHYEAETAGEEEEAPSLLEALHYLLEQTVDMDLKHGIGLSEGEEDARAKALAAIAQVAGRGV